MKSVQCLFGFLCFILSTSMTARIPLDTIPLDHIFKLPMQTYSECDSICDYQFKNLVSKEFSELIGLQSGNSLGNFAKLDLKENSVEFNGSLYLSDRSSLSINAKGASLDGILPVFSNRKVSNDLIISAGYNYLLGRPYLVFEDNSLSKLQSEEQKIIVAYREARLNARDSIKLQEFNTKIADVRGEMSGSTLSKYKMDSLKLVLRNLQELRANEEIFTQDDYESNAKNTFKRALSGLYFGSDSPINIRGFRMSWLSLGGTLQGRKFQSLSNISKTISKASATLWSIEAKYNLYRKSSGKFGTFYLASGLRYSKGDNFSELTRKEISIIDELGPNSTALLKFNAYEGAYKKNLTTIDLFADLYLFMSKNQGAAFHIFPSYQNKDSLEPVLNIGTGLLIPFRSKPSSSSIINAELFFEYYDVFNNNNSTSKALDRLSVGLKFSVPFNNKPIKYIKNEKANKS